MNCSDQAADTPPHQLLRQARKLLIEALDLMDRADAAGHLGARLQHVIDDLSGYRPDKSRR